MEKLMGWMVEIYGEATWHLFVKHVELNHKSITMFIDNQNIDNYISKAFLWYPVDPGFTFWFHMSVDWREHQH